MAGIVEHAARAASARLATHPDPASDQTTCVAVADPIRLTAVLDSSPQPYTRLEREIVEDGQQFGTVRTFTPPQAGTGVGLDASWLPDLSQLITADHRVLVTVSVRWPGAGTAARRGLAVRVARIDLAAAG